MSAGPLPLKVNGEPVELSLGQATVSELLAALGYAKGFVAVALNRTCVRRSEYATTPVNAGDEVEILAPMAGG